MFLERYQWESPPSLLRVIVETYLEAGSGLHGDRHVRPVEGQGYAPGTRV